MLLVTIFVVIRVVKSLLWPDGGTIPDGAWDILVRWGAAGWLILLPWAGADLAGWLLYRRHTSASDEVDRGASLETMTHEVAFRIVTRGDQPWAATDTVANILDTMQTRPLFPFTIEVVTDIPIATLSNSPEVRQIVVPDDYATSNGATHKARALHYAVETSPLGDRTWILHLDEESHITEELVVGIRNAVREEERSGLHRVGQGLILYHRDLETNRFLTMADSIRVGDDLGRFYFQYRLHRVMFGMHGSFVLVRNSVEKEVGFDFEPAGCVTEDTTWGLTQMDKGRRFRWVDGTVVEQSPRRLIDFLKQRRRWFSGMWWAAARAPVAWRHRSMLSVTMVLWSVAWFNLTYSWAHLLHGVQLPTGVALLGDFIFTVYLANYVLGLWVSLSARGSLKSVRSLGYLLLQVFLLPLHALIEASAVVYAFVKPESSFHVVAK